MVIHTFGAYFGLMVSRIISHRKAQGHKDAAPRYNSDLFAMIGFFFVLFIYFG